MKVNATAAGLAFGVFWAAGILGVTVIAAVTWEGGAGYGSVFIKLLKSVYPGYGVSAGGAAAGAAWGFADGFVSAATLAWLYNLMCRLLENRRK